MTDHADRARDAANLSHEERLRLGREAFDAGRWDDLLWAFGMEEAAPTFEQPDLKPTASDDEARALAIRLLTDSSEEVARLLLEHAPTTAAVLALTRR